ncbi:MAG: PQQ-binding-like beta-propeller repeat protein [Gammaproteobacteria bacterium]|nr:PQQ-binding-like beta-propeller repeat protein [Gammaproteobacteria bacterium]
MHSNSNLLAAMMRAAVKTFASLTASMAVMVGSNTAIAQQSTPGGQWLSYNNRLDGQRFSPLKELTPRNVDQLGEACRVQIDGPTSFHSALLVSDGVIYTNTGSETVAVDATTCALRWRFSYTPEDERFSPSSRGMALMNGRLYRGSGDGRLLALDAATGKLLWKTVIASPAIGESTGAAPLASGGVVYMGIGGSDVGARGRVLAFDAESGRELWRFYTIPMGDDVGAETWERPGTAKTGGGGIWGAMTLDVTTAELFVPVGNPWPDIDKSYRPGSNLFTNSVVVLDANTGALKWWYQVTPEDWRDLDLSAPPVLYRDGDARDIVAFAGKDGYVVAVDRDSHEMIFRTPVTRVETAPDSATPAGIRTCPGFAGGVEWNGPALDRMHNTLITGAVDLCFLLKLGTPDYEPGASNYGGSVEPIGEANGWVTAIDSLSGKVIWKHKAEKPVLSGVTPTAGGITLAGDLGGNLMLFDSKTGKLLRTMQTGGAMAGGLVTYDVAGKQYIAFASGNVSRNAFGALGLPSVVVMTLNPDSASTKGTAAGIGPVSGRKLYDQVCVSCHGPDGNMIADHKLSALEARRDLADTIAYIKNPNNPMPRLYPDLLDDEAIANVAAYLFEAF